MSGDAHEILRQELINEIDWYVRLWERRTVRRGVRRLVEIVRDGLVSGEIDVDTRARVAAAVSRIGLEPGWLPCDLLTVSRAIQTRAWDEEVEQPLCKLCRQKEDSCTSSGWLVGPSKATAR